MSTPVQAAQAAIDATRRFRERKSRWGSPVRKRKSRWGSPVTPPNPIRQRV